jgi:hypothetical protein
MFMNDSKVYPLEFGAEPVLEFQSELGALTILPVEPGRAPRMEAQENRWTKVDVTREGDTVKIHLQIEHPRAIGDWWEWIRHSRIRLFLPEQVIARVHLGAGKLAVSDLKAKQLDLHTAAGAMSLRRVSGHLTLRNSAGAIKGDHLSGSLVVGANGSVKLGIDSLEPGDHAVDANFGSVRVELAKGLPVQIQADTSWGSVINDYPEVAEPSATLAIRSQAGAIRVFEEGAAPRHHHHAHHNGHHHRHHGHGRRQWAQDWAQDFARDFAKDWSRDWAGERLTPPVTPPERPGAVAIAERPRVHEKELQWVLQLVEDSHIKASDATGLIKVISEATRVRDEELQRVLKMLEDNIIKADEATDLVKAMQG